MKSIALLASIAALAKGDDCAAMKDTLLQYAAAKCGSELLSVMPPLRPNTVPTLAPTVAPTVAPPAGGSTEPTIGSYYPNWFVYKKHYMGVQKMNVFGQSAGAPSGEYVVFPSTLSNLMPKITHMYYAFLDVNADCQVYDKDPDASWYGKATPRADLDYSA